MSADADAVADAVADFAACLAALPLVSVAVCGMHCASSARMLLPRKQCEVVEAARQAVVEGMGGVAFDVRYTKEDVADPTDRARITSDVQRSLHALAKGTHGVRLPKAMVVSYSIKCVDEWFDHGGYVRIGATMRTPAVNTTAGGRNHGGGVKSALAARGVR